MFAPIRRVLTSHDVSEPNGTNVVIHDTSVQLTPALDGNAGLAPLFATLGLPTVTPPTLDSADIDAAVSLAPGVVTPGGANAQITVLSPNYRVGLHRTNSVDYNIFLEGSAYLITPQGEEEIRTLVSAGQVVVQRGTLHAWEAGPQGARWVTVVIAAEPVEIRGQGLPEVEFRG